MTTTIEVSELARLREMELKFARFCKCDTRVIKIIEATGHWFSITPRAILGRSRSANIVAARHVAMYVARITTDMSLMQIGEEFDRDHSCVINGIRQTIARAHSDINFYVKIEHVLAIVRKPPAGSVAG